MTFIWYSTFLVNYTLDNGLNLKLTLMGIDMALDIITNPISISMRVSLPLIKNMVKEYRLLQMDNFMKDSGRMGKSKDLAF